MVANPDALVAVGMNHRTAPVDIRERLALDDDGVKMHLRRMCDEKICSEALLISTCNRVEFYIVPVPGRQDMFARYLGAFRGDRGEPIDPYLYWHHGRDAVRHLFRVAASLDSMIVGEPQILGQVKSAVRVATESHSLGRVLTKLAHRSLSVAKRVRTETDIGRYRVGVGNAGVDLAIQIFGTLRKRRAMLLGVGEMGQQVATALQSAGLEELIVANRTYSKAVEVAEENNGTPIHWDRMEAYLPQVDVVIAATGASKPVLDLPILKRVIRERRWKPMFLVDLAVPRNIAPDVSDIDEVFLFNVDDLTNVVTRGQEARKVESQKAEALVDDEADKFLKTLAEVDIGPHIGMITRHAEDIRRAELERSKKLLDALDPKQNKALDAMTKAMVKKVLHEPLLAIRQAARDGDHARLEALLAVWEGTEDG